MVANAFSVVCYLINFVKNRPKVLTLDKFCSRAYEHVL